MQEILTKVTGVSVYRRSAEVTRKASVSLSAGTIPVQIHGMTSGADANSLRIYLPEGISCSNIHFLSRETEDENSESKRITEKINTLNEEIEICELQCSLWKENGDFTNRTVQTAEEIRAYIDALPERLAALKKKIAENSREVQKLQNDLNEAIRKENLPVICAQLTAPENTECEMIIQYRENEAFWEPVYEVHADTSADTQIRIRARITQLTRETWENVNISLLTGNPVSQSKKPELTPVYLNIRSRQPEAPMMMRANAMASGMMMGAAMADTAMMKRVETEEAVSENQETMTEYSLPDLKNLESGPEGIMADLQKFSLPAEYRTLAVPSRAPRGFRTAVIQSKDLPVMVSGKAAVYLNGLFTGYTDLDPDLNEETFEVSLGSEERIVLSRRETANRKASAFLKNQKTIDHAYEIKVTNNNDKEASVCVQDQIPVSQDKQITVDTLNLSGASADSETGIVTWNLKLSAHETKTLVLAYRVSLPKDEELKETSHRTPAVCPTCGFQIPAAGQKFCPNCGGLL